MGFLKPCFQICLPGDCRATGTARHDSAKAIQDLTSEMPYLVQQVAQSRTQGLRVDLRRRTIPAPNKLVANSIISDEGSGTAVLPGLVNRDAT